MNEPMRPAQKPANPLFSAGPTTKRPGFSLESLKGAALGRSHRSKAAMAKILAAIEGTRKVLQVPDDYRIALVPASDTGAVEMALWSLLGARGVDVMAWETFGKGWVTDIIKHLPIVDARAIEADYGELPDLSQADFDRDVVFTWNGTTSGVRVPDGNWIAGDRAGLTICDATSAAFAQWLDWPKLDVTTFSWQKVMGGEAQHGMLVLSPRAVERLESYQPPWPLPKIFRLTKGGKLIEGIFKGETINTPSMLCIEDYLGALEWARGLGGLKALIARADANAAIVARWIEATPWVENLARLPETRSNTGPCLKIVDPTVAALPVEGQASFAKRMAAILDEEHVARDIGAHRDAPPGLRIWTGATIEASNVEALTPWLDWAFAQTRQELALAA